MNLIWYLILISFSSCTIEVKPIPQHKPKKKAAVHRHSVKKQTKQTPSDFVRVSKEWMEEYRLMEETSGNYRVSDDLKIKALPNGYFLVPRHSYNHFKDLLLAKPTP